MKGAASTGAITPSKRLGGIEMGVNESELGRIESALLQLAAGLEPEQAAKELELSAGRPCGRRLEKKLASRMKFLACCFTRHAASMTVVTVVLQCPQLSVVPV
jgi:hypothetical protein